MYLSDSPPLLKNALINPKGSDGYNPTSLKKNRQSKRPLQCEVLLSRKGLSILGNNLHLHDINAFTRIANALYTKVVLTMLLGTWFLE